MKSVTPVETQSVAEGSTKFGADVETKSPADGGMKQVAAVETKSIADAATKSSVDVLGGALKALGIKKTIFIDDAFAPKFEGAFAASIKQIGSGAAELARIWGVGAWTTPDELDQYREDAKAHWGQLSLDQQRAIAKSLKVSRESGLLAPYWPKGSVLKCVAPDEVEGGKLDALVGTEPCLLFIDLSLSDLNDKRGLEILSRVKRLTTAKAVCVIFTNQGSAKAENAADEWEKLLSGSKLAPEDAVLINKAAADDVTTFEPELRRALLNGLSPSIRDWAKRVATAAIEDALNKFQLDGALLHAVVLQSSAEEGIPPTETLFRLLDDATRRARTDLASKGTALSQFNVLKENLSALAKLATAQESAPLNQRIREIRHRELYRTGLAYAGWSPAIGLGDLWTVTSVDAAGAETVESYLLIGQPCDMLLRKNGKRTLNWVVLVPIVKAKDDDLPPNHDTQSELPYFEPETFKSAWAFFKKARSASANVLDAVALVDSTVTAAKLRGGQYVHPSIGKRAGHLARWFEGSSARLDDLALFYGPGSIAKLATSPVGAPEFSAQFSIQRTGRVEPEFARALLQRYGNYVARHALPHDFAASESEG